MTLQSHNPSNEGHSAPASVLIRGAVPTINGNSPIEDVIREYLSSQIPKECTARGYRRHLHHAFGIMAVERLSELEPVHLALYHRTLMSDGRGHATHAQAVIALRSFLIWTGAMRGHDLHIEQVKLLLKVPRYVVIRPHETLDADEIKRYLAVAKKEGPRDHALALIALGAGPRVSELVKLDVRDVRNDGGGGTVIHIREGKGSKDRMIPVRREVTDGVLAYLAATGRKRGDLGPLFLPEDNGKRARFVDRLTTRSASRIIKHLAEAAGIRKRITPHALRHTFAFASYLYCRNLMAVSKLLGHSFACAIYEADGVAVARVHGTTFLPAVFAEFRGPGPKCWYFILPLQFDLDDDFSFPKALAKATNTLQSAWYKYRCRPTLDLHYSDTQGYQAGPGFGGGIKLKRYER